jgi:hypothetical protein
LSTKAASQQAEAAPGLPLLVAGLLQACALSSQPAKLPQVLQSAFATAPVA